MPACFPLKKPAMVRLMCVCEFVVYLGELGKHKFRWTLEIMVGQNTVISDLGTTPQPVS